MPLFATENGMLDRWAIWLSGLCIVHCLSGAVFFALAASAGGMLLDPIVHEVGLVIAILFGVIAIGRGAFQHGYMLPVAISSLGVGTMAGALSLPHSEMELIYTVLGVALLALGHDLNRRAYR
ncbi:MerC domain-containing protein [Parasphingopyxis algicola]|uniref:MerC domain-containing protein n=1 Tax=Parasphingopyxis algicola TaxID=2026624 RepID=UPI0015A0BE9C|nr:MerC domain-containing protein [Parasphingopyxis algicola]QLC23580.1 MerC domain-containing protein [Parasphingopyxis algicola]